MPYKVQFVGLVCFFSDFGTRQALLPDGRSPGNGIESHVASIQVAPSSVIDASDWPENQDTARGVFVLPPCSIELEGATSQGTLNTSQHDGGLPQLRVIDPNFEIDPDTVETIARLHLRNGTLAAYRIPGGTAAISE